MIHEFMNTHLYISNPQTEKTKNKLQRTRHPGRFNKQFGTIIHKKLSLNIKDHNPQKNQTIVPYHSIQYEFYIYVLVNYNLVNYTHTNARVSLSDY